MSNNQDGIGIQGNTVNIGGTFYQISTINSMRVV